MRRVKTRYRIVNFLWDVFMYCVLGPFWLVWIFCREMRNR